MKSYINPNIPVLKPSDTVDDALVLFSDYKVDVLPYVSEQGYAGNFSEDLLLNYDIDDRLLEIQALPEEIQLSDADPLLEGIRKMLASSSPFLPVMDEEHHFLGVVEKRSLLEELATKMSLEQQGGLLEIHLKGKDYSLAEISRIIESESGKIISLFAHKEGEEDLILTLKLDITKISTVVSALTRYGYAVVSYHSTEPVTNIEKDRFEQLMRYLSI
jgi:acetoin utilization protein AcuB